MADKKRPKTDKELEITEKPEKETKKKKEKGEKPKKNLKASLLTWGIIVVLLVALVIVVLNLRPGGGKNLSRDIGTPDYLQGSTRSILVCGIDNDEDRENEAWMTDVIMVVNFDMERGQATVLQIPRDTYVGQDLVEYGKINGLYYFGYKDVEGSSGINCLAETIHDQMQIYIDDYVLITMEGFRQIVDLLGGIEITIDEAMEFENFSLEAGTHLLTGEQADEFVRFRKTYEHADIDRTEVQRYFLTALMNKLFSMSTMEMASMASSIYPYLMTDLTISELLQLAGQAKNLSSDTITFVRVPGEPVSRYGLYQVDIYSVHTQELADILNQYMRPYSDPVPATDLNVIQVQKTTDEYYDPGETIDQYTGPVQDGTGGTGDTQEDTD